MRTFAVVLTCFFATTVMALENSQRPPKSLELLKCNSIKQGTLWASLMNTVASGVRTYNAIELVHFNSARKPYSIVYSLVSAKTGTLIRVGGGHFAMEFSSQFDGISQYNVVTLIAAGMDTTSDFMGNWKAVKSDGTETNDLVGCTIL